MGIGLRSTMLTVDRILPAPADAAWKVLVDLDAWPQWGPSVRRAAVDGPAATSTLGPGSTGKVWTAVGVALPFEITDWEPDRSWAWSVAGIPATTHAVTPTPAGCRVTFGVPVWAAAYVPVCVVALRRIEQLVAQP
jgi:uncharacterized protein YndB with AHSA1/START domain